MPDRFDCEAVSSGIDPRSDGMLLFAPPTCRFAMVGAEIPVAETA
jgi:hypothetical protein